MIQVNSLVRVTKGNKSKKIDKGMVFKVLEIKELGAEYSHHVSILLAGLQDSPARPLPRIRGSVIHQKLETPAFMRGVWVKLFRNYTGKKI